MRRFLLAMIVAAAGPGRATAVWKYLQHPDVGAQLAVYRIGQARSFVEATGEIAAIEREPTSEASLRGWFRPGLLTFLRTFLAVPA